MANEQDQVVSNPELDEAKNREQSVEEVEALIGKKEEEIEDLLCDVEDVEEVKVIVGKIESVAQEAIEDGKVTTALGEATHIMLEDLFGRAGIVDDKLLPSVEMFKNPKTVGPAMAIAVEAIGIAKKKIDVSVESANKLIAFRQHEVQVAQEAFMDSVKDFFVSTPSPTVISNIAQTADFIDKRSRLNLKERKKLEGNKFEYMFTGGTPLNFFVRGRTISSNLGSDLTNDAKTIDKLSDLLKKLGTAVSKATDDSGDSSFTSIMNELSILNGTEMLGGIAITVSKSKSKDGMNTSGGGLQKSSLFAGLVTGAPLLLLPAGASLFSAWAIGSVIGKVLHDVLSADLRAALEKTLFEGSNGFEAASKAYVSALEKFSEAATEFYGKIQSNKKSDNKAARDAIRIGYGLINIVSKHSVSAKRIYAKLA